MTTETYVIFAVLLIVAFAAGIYFTKKTASNPDSLRSAAFETIAEAVTLASKMQSSVPADLAAAAAQKAREDSMLASLKDAVSKL